MGWRRHQRSPPERSSSCGRSEETRAHEGTRRGRERTIEGPKVEFRPGAPNSLLRGSPCPFEPKPALSEAKGASSCLRPAGMAAAEDALAVPVVGVAAVV